MAIAPMTKVGILGYRNEMGRIISMLQDIGVVHVTPQDVSENVYNPSESHDKKLIELERTCEFLKTHSRNKTEKLTLDKGEIESFVKDYNFSEVLERINLLKNQIENNKREIGIHEKRIVDIEPFLALNYVPAEFKNFKRTWLFIGCIETQLFPEFLTRIEEKGSLYEVNVLQATPVKNFFTLYFHDDVADEVFDLLRDFEFEPLDTALRNDIPQNIYVEEKALLEQKNKEIEEASEELANFAGSDLSKLLFMVDHYRILVDRDNKMGFVKTTKSVFYLTGWIKSRDFDFLKKKLESNFAVSDIFKVDPEEDEDAPVALNNPKWMQPFEILTNMYGRPRKGMIDPTPWTGPFFAVFFAFCMTDAGYGLILALGSAIFLMLKGKKLAPAIKDFTMLMLYLGVLTIGAGVIAGSYFGWVPPEGSFLDKLALFNALDDAMLFFAISVVFGIIQICFGFGLSTFVSIKEEAKSMIKVRNFVVGLSWILMTIGLGIFITSYLINDLINYDAFLLPFSKQLMLYGAIGIAGGSLVLGIIGGEKIGSSLGAAIGFDGLYGITGLFGDLLSYARILALGISTGVIAGVINSLGGMIAGGATMLWLVAAIFIIVGHLAYTLLSTLSAFIHPLRLQFVEYFNRFYESGGTNFEPFRKVYVNADIESK